MLSSVLNLEKCSFRGSTSLAKTWQIWIERCGSRLIIAALTLSSQGLNFSKQISLEQSWMAQISANANLSYSFTGAGMKGGCFCRGKPTKCVFDGLKFLQC
jgi:hypothetical protein